jgi:hypothetical protein
VSLCVFELVWLLLNASSYHDVDVVSDASAIGGLVVAAKDRQMRTTTHGHLYKEQWGTQNQIVGFTEVRRKGQEGDAEGEAKTRQEL